GAEVPGQPESEGAAEKRLTTVAARRAAVAEARSRHAGISERHTCALVGCALSSQRYRSRRPPQAALRARLHALAVERVRWGYRRLHVLLRREGQRVNVKRVYRLYREEGLAVRRRKRKRVAVARAPQPAPTRINERWAMDFMSDVLVGGRRYPIQNAAVESFNGRMRDELLNQHWWRTLDEARRAVAAYREDYNRVRPHSALGNRTPEEVAATLRSLDLGVAVA